ncbi:MAG: twin-arginine translocase TatA/TatE family subunit [Bacteroidales bacterium]|jgi:TatA/E family protein of Tat protein translocase|nr:twin-arginine translocase TatA/TatE family subunit [Bacteroidales bacterium]
MTLLFLDISGGEILFIALVALIIFGPKQAGAIARKVGKTVTELRKATSSIKDEIMKEDVEMTQSISKPLQEITEEAEQVNLMYGLDNEEQLNEENRDKKETDRATTI